MAARRAASRSRPNKFRSYLWLVLAAIVLLIGLGLAYQPKLKSGWVVNCSGEECVASGHFHYELHVRICGKVVSFEAEGGELEAQHTHKESNKIHWHSSVPYDKQTGPKLDSSMTVAKTLKDLGIELSESCQGQPAALALNINRMIRPESYLTLYNWQDGDIIKLEVK